MPPSRAWVMWLTLAACSARAHDVPRDAPATGAAPDGPFRLVEPPSGVGPGERLPVVAARVFAIADTQLHHPYGKRGFAQSPFADRWNGIEVPIRPAALDDGADLLLETFLAEHRARFASHTLVYLGDAADLSCAQEHQRFFAVLARAGHDRLLMVTSNHDGFYVGNFTQKADADGNLEYTDMPEDWARACAEPGSFDDRRLTKGRAVANIAAVLPEAPAWATYVSTEGADDPSGYKKSWLAFARPLGGGDAGAPPAWGLFFDTIDYRELALSETNGAGSVASISREQLAALDRAMFEVDSPAETPPLWVAFGHHPLVELDARSRERLFRFLDARPRILAYVSAHTHYSDERVHTLPSGRKLVELVVGSTTDFSGPGAPQAGRILELRWDPARRTGGIASWRLVLDPDPLCRGIAPLSPRDPLGYTGYRIARDDVPDVPRGTWDLLWAWLEESDLASHRVAQTAGALLVENKLVRALAALYVAAPGTPDERRGELERIVESLVPDDPGTPLDDYDRWIDPVLADRIPPLARRMHTFGRYHDLFEAARATRDRDAERRRWFTCHAARAAEAEAEKLRREGKVWRFR